MAHPELKAKVEELGITSLAQFYTSTAKYDPDVFREDSEKLRGVAGEEALPAVAKRA